MSVNTTLILINAVVFLVDVFLQFALDATISALDSNLFTQPQYFWQLLTYGFVHDTASVRHVLFNMFALWLFRPRCRNDLRQAAVFAVVSFAGRAVGAGVAVDYFGRSAGRLEGNQAQCSSVRRAR